MDTEPQQARSTGVRLAAALTALALVLVGGGIGWAALGQSERALSKQWDSQMNLVPEELNVLWGNSGALMTLRNYAARELAVPQDILASADAALSGSQSLLTDTPEIVVVDGTVEPQDPADLLFELARDHPTVTLRSGCDCAAEPGVEPATFDIDLSVVVEELGKLQAEESSADHGAQSGPLTVSQSGSIGMGTSVGPRPVEDSGPALAELTDYGRRLVDQNRAVKDAALALLSRTYELKEAEAFLAIVDASTGLEDQISTATSVLKDVDLTAGHGAELERATRALKDARAAERLESDSHLLSRMRAEASKKEEARDELREAVGAYLDLLAQQRLRESQG